jgi:hypothetical protein
LVSQVPKSFLLQILGEERVTKFVIQEIVNSTMADYVKKVISSIFTHSIIACAASLTDHFVSDQTQYIYIYIYIYQENLNVKDQKINTIQTAEELKSLFIPGNKFGFNATIELENSEIDKTSTA